MLEKIISDGRAGAGQAARTAATAHRIATGGSTPDGVPPGPNVRDSDATLWFGDTTTPHAHQFARACQDLGKPFLPVSPDAEFQPTHVAEWIAENRVRTLNVAGNPEADEPGIGDRVEAFLGGVLERLGFERA